MQDYCDNTSKKSTANVKGNHLHLFVLREQEELSHTSRQKHNFLKSTYLQQIHLEWSEEYPEKGSHHVDNIKTF